MSLGVPANVNGMRIIPTASGRKQNEIPELGVISLRITYNVSESKSSIDTIEQNTNTLKFTTYSHLYM